MQLAHIVFCFFCCFCVLVCPSFSPKFKHWLAMPEMMHVGSLIVDDIQDESPIRRGGPSCHIMHGMPTAINVRTHTQ
jgi:geranylgeranyl pyrophosphate synthase